MKAWARYGVGMLIALSISNATMADDAGRRHLFVCRSPILAFDFWNDLLEVQRKGVKVTPQIAQQVCDGMKAGSDPQCIRIDAKDFKPIASGWQGAMAMSDGNTKVWFHSPDSLGWVHPDYYVVFVNHK